VTDPLFSRSAEDGSEPSHSNENASNSGSTTRRGLIAGAGAIGAAAVIGGAGRGAQPTAAQSKLIDTALAASTTSGSLSDIKHFVILMQENRSFDHYFGTLSGVRGFSDPKSRRRPWAAAPPRSSTSTDTRPGPA
jgi:phospholipase C